MLFNNDLFLDVKKIYIVHEFILDRVHRCEYPNGRRQFGIVYALSGKAEYRFFTGERITITEGDVLFLSPHAAYSIITEKEFKHYTVNFDIHKHSSQLHFLDKPYCLLTEVNTEQIKRSFSKLNTLWITKKTGYEMRSMSYLYELLSLFCFELTNNQHSEGQKRLRSAKEYIEQHFTHPICLEELAALSNMSITNFRREWKKQYAQSPLQYRDSIRLYYAKEYLNSGYYTVSEIAEKCGFDDTNYFVRFFKKNVGITPGAFKKSLYE